MVIWVVKFSKRGIQNEVEKLGINSEKKVFQKSKLSKNVITKKNDSKLFNKKELKKDSDCWLLI